MSFTSSVFPKENSEGSFKPKFGSSSPSGGSGASLESVKFESGLDYNYTKNTLSIDIADEVKSNDKRVVSSDAVSKKLEEYPTKDETNEAFDARDAAIDTKADQTFVEETYYTKEETNTIAKGKVDKIAGKGLSTNDYTNADKEAVSNIDYKLASKVDKVTGMGLSQNSFTNTERNKLQSIENNAQANVLNGISVNGTPQIPIEKIIALNVMTNTVDDLTNYYLKSETYTKEEVNELLARLRSFNYEIVNAIPETVTDGTVYLVRNQNESGDDLYSEYLAIGNTVEYLGSHSMTIDLSQYVTNVTLSTILQDYATTQYVNHALEDYVTNSVFDGIIGLIDDRLSDKVDNDTLNDYLTGEAFYNFINDDLGHTIGDYNTRIYDNESDIEQLQSDVSSLDDSVRTMEDTLINDTVRTSEFETFKEGIDTDQMFDNIITQVRESASNIYIAEPESESASRYNFYSIYFINQIINALTLYPYITKIVCQNYDYNGDPVGDPVVCDDPIIHSLDEGLTSREAIADTFIVNTGTTCYRTDIAITYSSPFYLVGNVNITNASDITQELKPGSIYHQRYNPAVISVNTGGRKVAIGVRNPITSETMYTVVTPSDIDNKPPTIQSIQFVDGGNPYKTSDGTLYAYGYLEVGAKDNYVLANAAYRFISRTNPWQTSNRWLINTNGIFYVAVRDKNGNLTENYNTRINYICNVCDITGVDLTSVYDSTTNIAVVDSSTLTYGNYERASDTPFSLDKTTWVDSLTFTENGTYTIYIRDGWYVSDDTTPTHILERELTVSDIYHEWGGTAWYI